MDRIFQEIAGDTKTVGRATGLLMGSWMQQLVRIYPAFYRRQKLDYKKLRNRALDLIPPARAAFPWVIKEFEATARAAQVSFDDAWFMAAEEDVTDEIEWAKHPDHCTTIILNTSDTRALVHNEDYDGRYRGMVAVQRARPRGSIPFYRFLYPCGLPGTTCGVNAAGIAFSEDSLHFPVNMSGVTKNVIFRALLGAQSISEVAAIIKNITPSNAFALNVVSSRERKAVVIERTTTKTVVLPVTSFLVHANQSLAGGRLGADEGKGTHSHKRVREVNRMIGTQPTRELAEHALASPKFVRSPYRGQKAYMTLATVVTDFNKNRFGLKVWGKQRPGWQWWPLTFFSYTPHSRE